MEAGKGGNLAGDNIVPVKNRLPSGMLALLVGVGVLPVVYVVGASQMTPSSRQVAAASSAATSTDIMAGKSEAADPTVVMPRLRTVAQKTHGDWNQLALDDQRFLDGLTGGHGRQMFTMLARGK